MEFDKFLTKVINLGIKSAKRDYNRNDQKAILKGSIAGFEACRGLDVFKLTRLLEKSRKDSFEAMKLGKEDINKYWEARGFTLEVEWVCNVVSASLYNQKLPVIITPTARGMITASKILGVKNK